MVNVALVVRMVAKPGKEEELRHFLASAQALAQGETFTPAWFALRTEPNVFWIVDAFENDADRGRHLGGEIARSLMEKAPDLLARPPEFEKADVLGAKLPS